MKYFYWLFVLGYASVGFAQNTVRGIVTSKGKPVEFATVAILKTKFGTNTDLEGHFQIAKIPNGKYTLQLSSIGYESSKKEIQLSGNQTLELTIELKELANKLDEVVITGTMKEVSKLESPVSVEIYTPKFFQKNPTPSIFDALQNVNGIRPQLNCNVCNTGDIHINGLEGPYTMVMIDGMPIVSSLSTVYGLSGIPNSLVERIEIVKGPASTLYGSEAVAGLINIITKNPSKAPTITADVFGTTWKELSVDVGAKFNLGETSALIGVNAFNFGTPTDKNGDGFTDMTLQHRVSVFNKYNFKREKAREATLAARYFYEFRWGGQTNWTLDNRGKDDLYGESIYTKRLELIGSYQLPTSEHLMFRYSYNYHNQDSYYGIVPYMATQQIFFGQLTWDKSFGKHDILVGTPLRYTYYDDNTPATTAEDGKTNRPDKITLPGIFVQDEWRINDHHKFLFGLRYDYNSLHGNIFTPRLSYKWSFNNNLDVFRFNFGTGYRVVNLFTEDHAALTGARQVVLKEALKPEQSWNINLNYVKKFILRSGFIGLDASAFYTYFTNKILPDYNTDPNKIIYTNLDGYAVSKGISINLDFTFASGLKILAGTTLMDVSRVEEGVKSRQLLTERMTGTWGVSYEFKKINLSLDYTGNFYSPMLLPLLSPEDPRPSTSPTWSLQNIQFTKKLSDSFEVYGGVKNLLNFLPYTGVPFLIARANDPFDKQVVFDANGQVVATPNNPYRLTFDPNYVYAPQQSRRGFLGLRYTLK
ncbi:MAG: TonB-dependent receptor [Spirosomataceae bacterium]